MSTACVQPKKLRYRVPVTDRFRVAYHNWCNRHVGKALRTLSKALRDDPSFRQTWHANIAMPIYDATRPKCVCSAIMQPGGSGHFEGCEMLQAESVPRRFECREMSIEQANHIADKLMAHLFNA